VVWLLRRPPAKQVTEDIYTDGSSGRRRHISTGRIVGPALLFDRFVSSAKNFSSFSIGRRSGFGKSQDAETGR
jgi:hypothetical protein